MGKIMAEKPVAPKRSVPPVKVEHKKTGNKFEVSAKYFEEHSGSLKRA